MSMGVFAARAPAAEIRLDPTVSSGTAIIDLSGEVRRGDLIGIEDVVAGLSRSGSKRPIVVRLNSPGGNHFEGQVIALWLKRRGIGTLVSSGATCASACASIFFGGFELKAGRPNRVVEEGARVGVHRMVRVGTRPPRLGEDERVVGGAGWFLDELRVAPSIQRKFFDTPPSQIAYLSNDEMAASQITVRPAGTSPRPASPATEGTIRPAGLGASDRGAGVVPLPPPQLDPLADVALWGPALSPCKSLLRWQETQMKGNAPRGAWSCYRWVEFAVTHYCPPAKATLVDALKTFVAVAGSSHIPPLSDPDALRLALTRHGCVGANPNKSAAQGADGSGRQTEPLPSD